VDLVKTSFVNPVYPKGRDLIIFQSLRFSYRFLQSLVIKTATTKRRRFARIIDFLEVAHPWADRQMDKSREWTKTWKISAPGGVFPERRSPGLCTSGSTA